MARRPISPRALTGVAFVWLLSLGAAAWGQGQRPAEISIRRVDGEPLTTIELGERIELEVAIDAGSGKIKWTFDADMQSAFSKRPSLSWISRANRGVAVWDGSVFVATADCRLIAIGADRGRPRWTKQVCDPDQGYSISDSPYVGGGKVYVMPVAAGKKMANIIMKVRVLP